MFKKFGIALVLLLGGAAGAQEAPISFGLCYDLTAAYSIITPQVAQAVKDLAKLKNIKGGVEGHPVNILLKDQGGELQRAVACYKEMKDQGAIAFDFYSTPIAKGMIGRLMDAGDIMLQPVVGRGDVGDGTVFKTVFQMAPTYWSQIANIVSYIKKQEGGQLKNIKLAFMYVDNGFGQEPLPVLEQLSNLEGFELLTYPVTPPGTDQTAIWSKIRRAKPDWIVHWATGDQYAVAAKGLETIGFATDRYFVGGWFSGIDMNNAGAERSKGILQSAYINIDPKLPLVREIMSELYDKGEGSGDLKNMDVNYFTGLAIYSNWIEGAELAIKNDGWPITSTSYKKALESLVNYDANGLMAPQTITASDHEGGGRTRIQQWDGERWNAVTDWYSDYRDIVRKLMESSAKGFTTK